MWQKPNYYLAAISTLPVIAACALLGATEVRAATCAADPCDPYVVTFQQEGSNIVATGTGEFDPPTTTGGNIPISSAPTLNPQNGILTFGAVTGAGVQGFNVSGPTINGTTPTPLTQSFALPGIIGTNPTTIGSPGPDNGPIIVGINGGIPGFSPQGFFSLSANYMPGEVITNQVIFANMTLSCVMPLANPCGGLGVNPDQVIMWTWGPDPDQSLTINTTLLPEIPLPAALPLFATGLGGLGLLGWRRKRRAQAVA